jgi:hypothetical protein
MGTFSTPNGTLPFSYPSNEIGLQQAIRTCILNETPLILNYDEEHKVMIPPNILKETIFIYK